MVIFLYFAIMFINLIEIIRKKESKLLILLSIVVLTIIYAGNSRDNFSDIRAYRNFYNLSITKNQPMEKGYAYIADLLSNKGVSFECFLFLIFLLFVVSFFIISYKVCCSYSVFVFMYGSFWLFYSMECLRFFISVSLIIIAVKFLIDKKKKEYILIILLAALFHKFAFYFLIYSVVDSDNQLSKRKYKYFAIVCLISCMLIFINGNEVPFLKHIYVLVFGNWKNTYFNKKTHLGFIPYFLYHVFNIIFNLLCIKIVDSCTGLSIKGNKIIKKLRNFSNLCWKCNLLTFSTFPLIMVSTVFFRISFSWTLITFILVSCTIGITYSKEIITNMRNMNKLIRAVAILIPIWSIIWWILDINRCSLIDALRMNYFN